MRSVFCQLLCIVLSVLLIFPPAIAANIEIDRSAPSGNQAGLDQARNGVPIVNIANPNRNGISHNKFNKFNVLPQGVIVNNSRDYGRTQLGGFIHGNPNLRGRQASTIINEVTGASRSLLQGYTEVFGGGNYIFANPNGITINGGGFIGTPRAIVTTGIPSIQNHDVLLNVSKGDVLIEGAGINASNLDSLEIVSRVAKINAEVHAKQLKVVTGKNSYAALRGEIQSSAEEGGVGVSIDSSILGGMYADRIYLVGTEKGVGVNLDGIIQSTNDLVLTADGDVAVKNAITAGTDITLTSGSGAVAVDATVKASTDLNVAGKEAVVLSGTAISGNDASFLSEEGEITISGEIRSGGKVSLTGNSNVNVLSAIASANKINVVSNEGGVTVQGVLSSTDATSINAQKDITLEEDIVSGGSLLFKSNEGSIEVQNSLTAIGGISFSASGRVLLNEVIKSGGTIKALSLLESVEASTLLTATDEVLLSAENDITLSGEITAGQRVNLTSDVGGLHIAGNISGTEEVELVAADSITIIAPNVTAKELTVRSTNGSVNSDGVLNVAHGLSLFSFEELTLRGDINASELVVNSGKTFSQLSGVVTVSDSIALSAEDFVNLLGEVRGGGRTEVTSRRGAVSVTNLVSAQGDLFLFSHGMLDISGDISSAGAFKGISEQGKLNSTGELSAQSNLTLQALNDIVANGSITSGNELSIHSTAGELRSTAELSAVDDLTLRAFSGLSLQGNVVAEGSFQGHGTEGFINSSANISAKNGIEFIAKDNVDIEGDLFSQSGIEVVSNLGQVEYTATSSSTNDTSLTSFLNMELGGTIVSRAGVLVNAAQGGLTSSGIISTRGGMSFEAQDAIVFSGEVTTEDELTIASTVGAITSHANLSATKGLSLASAENLVLGGTVVTDGVLSAGSQKSSLVSSADVSADNGVSYQAEGDIELTNSVVSGAGFSASSRSGKVTVTGTLSSASDMALTALSDLRINNSIASAGGLRGVSSEGTLGVTARLTAADSIVLTGYNDINLASSLVSDNGIDLTSTHGAFTLSEDIFAKGNISLTALERVALIADANAIGSINVISQQNEISSQGVIAASDDVSFSAKDEIAVTNKIESQKNITLNSTESAVVVSGVVVAEENASITAKGNVSVKKISSTDKALIKGKSVEVTGDTFESFHLVAAAESLEVDAVNIENTGTMFSGGTTTLNVSNTLQNDSGSILSTGDMLLEGETAGQRMVLLENDSALIESLEGSIVIRADQLQNINSQFEYIAGTTPIRTQEGGDTGSKSFSYATTLFSWATGRSPSGGLSRNAGRISTSQVAALGFASSRNVLSRDEIRTAVARIEQELLADPNYLTPSQLSQFQSARGLASRSNPYFIKEVGRTNGVIYAATTTRDSYRNVDKGAHIAALNSIRIEGRDVQNRVSKITTATGDIVIDSDLFENVGQDIYERSSVTWGRAIMHNHQSPHVQPTGRGTDEALTIIDSIYGTVDSGNSVTITASHASNGIVERGGVVVMPDPTIQQGKKDAVSSKTDAENVDGAASSTVASVADTDSASSANVDDSREVSARDAADVSDVEDGLVQVGEAPVAPIVSIDDIINSIPVNGLFVLNESPSHPYLIETNPAFADFANFVDATFVLNQLGTTPEGLSNKLVGDGFYITRLIREQVLKETGHRFLSSSVKSDTEQVQNLMNQALAQEESLGLTPGVALSNEQIAALNEDIVWLVEHTVKGQKVLVPVVYLGQNSLSRIAEGGSVIAAADAVTLDVDGEIRNAGVVQAGGELVITADNIFNTQGSLKGDVVTLAATDSITNSSASITGRNVNLNAQNDIVTTTNVVTDRNETTVAERAGAQSSIKATENVSMVAGNDISITGTDVTAVENITLTAGNDVSVSTVQTTSTSAVRGSKQNTRDKSVGHRGSDLRADGNVVITAKNDVTVHGSNVSAQGDIQLAAEGNVSIASAESTESYYQHTKGKGGGFGGSKKSSNREGDQTLQTRSQIRSGGDVSVVAEGSEESSGDIGVIGSRIKTGGDVELAAEGALTVTSSKTTLNSSSNSKSKGFLKSKGKVSQTHIVEHVGSEIETGGVVSATASEDITVSASSIHGEEGVTLTSEQGDVKVVAAQNEYSSYSKEKKSGFKLNFSDNFLSIAEKSEERNSSLESGNVGSTITSNKTVAISAENDAVVVGSDILSNENVEISAGRDVNIVSGRNEKETKSFKKKGAVGIGFNFSEEEIGVFAGVKAVEKGEEFAGTYNASSSISAGGDVDITAGRNVNQVSSDIEAGENVTVTAGENIAVEAAHDVETLDSYVREIEVGVKLAAKQNVSRAVNSVAQLPESAQAGKGSAAAEAVTAASAAMESYSAVSSALSSSASASLTVGATYSESRQQSSSSKAVASTIRSGNDLTVTAEKDVTIDGSHLLAENDLSIEAGKDVTITASTDTYTSSSSSTYVDARAGIGGSVGATGASGGVTGSAAYSASEGQSKAAIKGNAGVSAGENLSITSGKDTTIEGANVEGNKVAMNVGEDLTVRSLQNETSSKSSHVNLSASVTLGLGADLNFNGQDGGSGSIGAGKSKAESEWVDRQTSIIGREEVDIYTENNTHIEGAVIAAENGNLTINTGTLTYEDIKDSDQGESIGGSLSASMGDSPTDINTTTLSGEYGAHDKRQVNRATIGEGTIIIRSNPEAGLEGLNRDLARAQEVTKNNETVVKVFIDTDTIKDIASGGEELVGKVKNAKNLVSDYIADLRKKESLSPQEIEEFKDMVSENAVNMLAAKEDKDSAVTRELLSDEVGKEYSRLRAEGKSNSEALAVIENQLARFSDVADILYGNGLELTYVGGKPYLANTNSLLAVAVADDVVLVGATVVTGAILKRIQEKHPEIANEFARGIKNACAQATELANAGGIALNALFVKFIPAYAAATGQAVLVTASGSDIAFDVDTVKRDIATGELTHIQDGKTGEYYRVGRNEQGQLVVDTSLKYEATANGMEVLPGYGEGYLAENEPIPGFESPPADTSIPDYPAENGVDTSPLTTPDEGNNSPTSYVTPDQSGELEIGKPILSENGKIWEKSNHNDRVVYKNNEAFDPYYYDSKSGMSNLQRMEKGRPPIGKDGYPIELHHMVQNEVQGFNGASGPLVELEKTFHAQNYDTIHIYKRNDPEYISWRKTNPQAEKQYNKFRKQYWKVRAGEF